MYTLSLPEREKAFHNRGVLSRHSDGQQKTFQFLATQLLPICVSQPMRHRLRGASHCSTMCLVHQHLCRTGDVVFVSRHIVIGPNTPRDTQRFDVEGLSQDTG